MFGLEVSNRTLRVIHVLPVEIHRQVSVVYELERLGLVLALVGGDKLADACVDAAQFHCIAVEVDLRCLHFAEELEE